MSVESWPTALERYLRHSVMRVLAVDKNSNDSGEDEREVCFLV